MSPAPTTTTRIPEPFIYRLKAVAKVVDGDTLDLELDLGFSITLRQRVRLYGIETPDVRTMDPIEKAKGQESQAFVSQWFERSGGVLVRTSKEEKYDRMLADCYREGEPNLCTELLDRGLARPCLP
jgi:micrococcal nuclease